MINSYYIESATNDFLFQKAFSFTMQNEGYISNHPLDKGGLTKFGITMPFLNSYMMKYEKIKEATKEELENITKDEAMAIYYCMIWDEHWLSRYGKLGIILFDQIVNRGAVFPIKSFQKIIFAVTDGHLGLQSYEAFKKLDKNMVLLQYIFECQDAYVRIVQKDPSQLAFLGGWINRTQEYFKFYLEQE